MSDLVNNPQFVLAAVLAFGGIASVVMGAWKACDDCLFLALIFVVASCTVMT